MELLKEDMELQMMMLFLQRYVICTKLSSDVGSDFEKSFLDFIENLSTNLQN